MPSSNATALATAYQVTQKDLAAETADLVLALWASHMAQSADLRKSADDWLALAIPLILSARRVSAQYGQAFYKGYRRLELPAEPSFTAPAIPELDRKILTSSLWVVGPQQYVDAGKAVDDIFSEERVHQIAGAAARHIMDGGRAAVDSAYESDTKATGYYRVEDGDPCYFCAMLMSRGTVFKGDSFDESDVRFFGPGDAKVHDHCGGSLVAAYDDEPYPADTKKYNDLWTGGQWDPVKGDVVLGWRHFYDAQRNAEVTAA